uniref:C-type lectin domain-containing protein n=1 Tax=Periophthalmus magnuspinnatus TaxID=409849 RepID=A0A3B4AEA9_9GOBI
MLTLGVRLVKCLAQGHNCSIPLVTTNLLILLLIFVCGTGLSSVVRRYIWYNKYPSSWQGARANCQSQNAKLLTVVTQFDIINTNMDIYYAWIALKLYNNWWWTDGTNFYSAGNGDFVKDEPDDIRCQKIPLKCHYKKGRHIPFKNDG